MQIVLLIKKIILIIIIVIIFVTTIITDKIMMIILATVMSTNCNSFTPHAQVRKTTKQKKNVKIKQSYNQHFSYLKSLENGFTETKILFPKITRFSVKSKLKSAFLVSQNNKDTYNSLENRFTPRMILI